MDIRKIEQAAEIVFRMCRDNPELCPHDFEWIGSSTKYIADYSKTIHTYRCNICGIEKQKIEESGVKT